jgi:hypothetical protein
MESPASLKAETEALCLDIEQLGKKLGAKTITFDVAEELWRSAYRPKARALAEAMLSYVPSDDPRIIVEFQAGHQRVMKSDAVICIEASLSEGLASVHLCTVVKQLRGLTDYNGLPTD